MITEAEITFAVELLGEHYHVVSLDPDGDMISIVEGTATRDMAECKLLWESVKDCPTCKRQARGIALLNSTMAAGPLHFGSPNCRCGSLAAGGYRAHCCCSCCY